MGYVCYCGTCLLCEFNHQLTCVSNRNQKSREQQIKETKEKIMNDCECGRCSGCLKKIFEAIYIEHPREPTPKEKAEKSFERFMYKLMSAIHLTGGSGTLGDWENKTIKEIYEDLHPNGIHLKFSLDFDNKDRTYSGD